MPHQTWHMRKKVAAWARRETCSFGNMLTKSLLTVLSLRYTAAAIPLFDTHPPPTPEHALSERYRVDMLENMAMRAA